MSSFRNLANIIAGVEKARKGRGKGVPSLKKAREAFKADQCRGNIAVHDGSSTKGSNQPTSKGSWTTAAKNFDGGGVRW